MIGQWFGLRHPERVRSLALGCTTAFGRVGVPWKVTLEMLRKGDIDLNGREADVAAVLSGHLINYNDTWDKIQLMLDEIMSSEYRRSFVDSFGGYWKFSWHCLDHVGFEYNPRRRDMGYHNIFDYYSRILKANSGFGDDIQWHFHPMSANLNMPRLRRVQVFATTLLQCAAHRETKFEQKILPLPW